MTMFTHLRTKLTVLYVALFVAALAVLSVSVYIATTRNVERVIRDQLAVSGTVFAHLSDIKTSRLQDEAGILAHDFGFRAAVATGDQPTIRSALDNLAARFGIQLAFVINADGALTRQDGEERVQIPRAVIDAIQAEDGASGVFTLNGVVYEGVAAPILTPAPAGWVVFASVLGPQEMANLSHLSALPLKADVVLKGRDGRWSIMGARDKTISPALQRIAGESGGAIGKLAGADGDALALVKPLQGFGHEPAAALLLRCSLADALQPYKGLAVTILLVGLVMILLVVAGSWLLARTVTRSISALESAARRLQHGESARVQVKTSDEIARLGLSFNAMADEIEERTASLKHARNAAEAANAAKDVFLANMNHEVRTPLNGVLGVAGLLATTQLDADQRRMVDIIEMSGTALNRILNDILDMVDVGSDDLDLIDRSFDLGAMACRLATATSAQCAAKNLEFRFDIAPAADCWMRGDERRIEQILSNLLDNALKFTDRGEIRLDIGVTADASHLRFEVRDTGLGFEQSNVETLFTAFSQADGSMTRKAGGTGLGLSLARDIAQAMGGDIVAKGEPGAGSAFSFTLPLRMADVQTPPSVVSGYAVTSAEDEPPLPIRVLLAEDHPANRMVIQMILASVDVELFMAENGAEAVEAYKNSPFDLVLMDLQMPVMDGLEAIKAIRSYEVEADVARTPILVVSANVQSAHLRASAEAGADGHLAKPIQAPVLLAALEQALSVSATQEQCAA